jgi:hypothetical protein
VGEDCAAGKEVIERGAQLRWTPSKDLDSDGLHKMEIYPDKYYHIYNRTNNSEIAFRSSENYDFFLSKYRKYLGGMLDTLAYCLMPTHFHFLVIIRSEETDSIKNAVGIMLSSYTKAINKRYNRHGSLFQLSQNLLSRMITCLL